MKDDTLLYRQVHPNCIQNGEITRLAFIPSRNHDKQLSVYNGELITAKDAWEHHTTEYGYESVGVVAVSCGECGEQNLPVTPDPDTFPSHAIISFQHHTTTQIKRRIASELAAYARERGWQYQAD